MNSCRGKCSPHRVRTNMYENGQKRCNTCEVFLQWDGVRCPCCSRMLRTKSRYAKRAMKRCDTCKMEKRITLFYRDRSTCRRCARIHKDTSTKDVLLSRLYRYSSIEGETLTEFKERIIL